LGVFSPDTEEVGALNLVRMEIVQGLSAPAIARPVVEPDSAPTIFARTDLIQKIDAGFRKRSDDSVFQVFQKYQDDAVSVIPRHKLKDALEELEINMTNQERAEFVESMDTSGDGVLDFEEFKRAVRYPGPIEQWAKTMNLAQLLSDSIPVQESSDSLKAVSRMSSEDIDQICAAFVHGLKRMLAEHVQALQTSFEAQDSRDAQADNQARKFEIFSMSCGKIYDFHKGISGRVGECIGHLFFEFVDRLAE
jgi:hypothetical protein